MTGLDALLRNPRYEVIPARATERAVLDWIPAGMTVTASPVKGLEPTIELAERLAARGYRVVPHPATYIVSNVCFDPAGLGRWIQRIRARGVTLPLYAGLAGPAESARFITRHPGWILRFWAPGGYSPDRFLDRAAAVLTAPQAGVAGLHLFTFNQLQPAEQWRSAALERTANDKRLLAG